MSKFNILAWFKRKEHDEYQAIRRVYDTDDGKALFKALFREAGINELSAKDDDAYGTYLREGKRSIGIAFRKILTMTDEELTRLLSEEKPLDFEEQIYE